MFKILVLGHLIELVLLFNSFAFQKVLFEKFQSIPEFLFVSYFSSCFHFLLFLAKPALFYFNYVVTIQRRITKDFLVRFSDCNNYCAQ